MRTIGQCTNLQEMTRLAFFLLAAVFGASADSAITPLARTPANFSQRSAASSADNPMTGEARGVGAPDIPTADHNVLKDLMPSWDCVNGVCGQPAPASGDQIGAFRFICRHTNLAADDPTVYPGRPGASHLHDQTGVYGWNASSTYRNLRTGGGGSGCNDVAGQDHNPAERNWSANRTPYWQPALLDGKGNVILADYTSFYYKRRSASDPVVSDPANPKYIGQAVPLPNGLKFIFGAFMDPGKAPVPPFVYGCIDAKGHPIATDGSFAGAVACVKSHNGPTGAGYQLNIHQSAPSCWDGVNLDSPDHRSHMAYPKDTHLGYSKCDAAHPFVVPTFTYAADYTLLSTDDGDIHFSSDEADNSKPRGWSFHVDYGPAAWDPVVLKMWTDGCINKVLNCSGGDLGNGKQLKGAAKPIYYSRGSWTSSWQIPKRLVPIPPARAM